MGVTCEIAAGQFTVRGLSLGGIETCMQVPQLDLCFDVGHCPRSFAATKRLFITHGHADHSGGLVGMLGLRLLHGMTDPLEVYAPAPDVADLAAAVAAYERLQGHPYVWRIRPLVAGDEVKLDAQRVVRAFRSVHVVPTLGYTAWERVKKLRAEFRGLPGPEIARRKHAGEDLFDEVSRPLVSFPGDTTVKTLDQEPHLYKSRVLLLEATYIDDRKTVAQCHRHGHVHLDELIERAEAFENEHLVLTHFSQSYRPEEVHEIVRRRTAGLFRPQVHVFAPESGTWPG